jgi:kinase
VRIDQESSSSSNRDAEASTSSSMKPVKTEKAGADLPKEMNGMTISDDKVDGHNDKVSISFIHSLLTS